MRRDSVSAEAVESYEAVENQGDLFSRMAKRKNGEYRRGPSSCVRHDYWKCHSFLGPFPRTARHVLFDSGGAPTQGDRGAAGCFSLELLQWLVRWMVDWHIYYRTRGTLAGL